MGWSNMEEQTTNNKKGMATSSKILLGIIACLILIILLIMFLIINVQENTFILNVDGISKEINKDTLLTKVDNTTYVDIQEFSKLVGYEYHKGEYKAFTIEENKCYVEGKNETASFFVDDNKVYKLPIDNLTSEYNEYIIEKPIKEINGKMYAPLDAINLAFNVSATEKDKSLIVYTLDYLVRWYDTNKIKEWGYASIENENFENKKALLYGYLIVKKEDGLYKIIDDNNTKEIVSDKYISIQFTENTKEFFVTNSLEQVGIINLDGTTKIEPIYESITVFDKDLDFYLIEKEKKYGIVKSGNISIVHPEYDKIGLNISGNKSDFKNKYLIQDTLIPVCKENKWGACDTKGNLIFKVIYDDFGCNITEVEVNGSKKVVNQVLNIEECKGVVVKQGEKYKLLDITGKELISTGVDAIYLDENSKNDDYRYYMLHKNKELNIMEELIKADIIKDPRIKEELVEDDKNTLQNNIMNNSISNNTVEASNSNIIDNTVTTVSNKNKINNQEV